MAILFQESLVLHGTVRENIAFGRPDATADAIEAAARAADAHEFILALPDGYDTDSASAAAASPAGSASGSRSPGRCSPTRRC